MPCKQYDARDFGCVRCFGIAAEAVARDHGFSHALVVKRKGQSTQFEATFDDYAEDFEREYREVSKEDVQRLCNVVANEHQMRRLKPWCSTSKDGKVCCKTIAADYYETYGNKRYVVLYARECEGEEVQATATLRTLTDGFRIAEMTKTLKSIEGWIFR